MRNRYMLDDLWERAYQDALDAGHDDGEAQEIATAEVEGVQGEAEDRAYDEWRDHQLEG